MRRARDWAWNAAYRFQRMQALRAATRWESFVFGVPIMLGLVFVFFLAPDTARKWEMWHDGLPATGTLRRVAENMIYLDYEANGRLYTTGGFQKPGSDWLPRPDGQTLKLSYLPSDPRVVELGDRGSQLAELVVEDLGVIGIVGLWLRFAWTKWLLRPPAPAQSTA
jgi:hypothetical protein